MFNSMKNLSARLIKPTDQPFLFELFTDVRGKGLENTLLSDHQKQAFLQSQFDAMHTSYAENFPSAQHHIVSRSGKDVGRIYTNISHDEIRILDMIIHAQVRGSGIGSELMRTMIYHSNDSDKVLRFYVWATNTEAQRFYHHHGCEMVRDDGGYFLFERIPGKK